MRGATMGAGDSLCDGQTKTGPSAGASRVRAAEPLEGTREVVGLKAWPLIGYMQLN